LIGPIIRNLRKQKNIKSFYLYDGIMSRTARSKFERGISDTTTAKFFIILERLNITLEEIYYLLYKQENKDFIIINNYIDAFYNNDINKLLDLKDLTYKEFTKTNTIKYLHYHAVISLLINLKSGEILEEEKLGILRKYLLECESWGYYEIVLFTNTMEFYSLEIIDIVYRRCKSYLLEFKGSRRYKNEQAIFILNILEITVKQSDIERTQYYLKHFKEISSSLLDNIYFKTMEKYFSCILLILKEENVIEQKKEIQKILDFLSFLEMKIQYVQCKDLYELVLKKIS